MAGHSATIMPVSSSGEVRESPSRSHRRRAPPRGRRRAGARRPRPGAARGPAGSPRRPAARISLDRTAGRPRKALPRIGDLGAGLDALRIGAAGAAGDGYEFGRVPRQRAPAIRSAGADRRGAPPPLLPGRTAGDSCSTSESFKLDIGYDVVFDLNSKVHSITAN